jgi:sulfatase maturation enzyme AslB (radical SAM superfamily)
MKMLRESMLNGERPESCSQCWRLDNNNLTSNRARHLDFYKKQFLTKYLHDPKISSLDIKPGKLCNFKCRICGSEASSSHIKEQNKFRTIPLSLTSWADSESLLNSDILKLNDQLENLDLYGGEPFLVKSLTTLVKKLSRFNNAKNIRLHYNTNGSVFPEFLIDYWKYFKEINIMFSIDDVGNRFEIQRGGNWDFVNKNIEKFCDLDLENLSLGVMPTINVMNVLYIDEVMDWADKKNLTVHFNYLKSPIGYSLKQLTRSAKEIIFKKHHNTKYTEIENLMKDIDDMPDGDGKEFLKLTNYYDNIRNENFYASHSEIFTAMSSC